MSAINDEDDGGICRVTFDLIDDDSFGCFLSGETPDCGTPDWCAIVNE
jgi:hypothetical protein